MSLQVGLPLMLAAAVIQATILPRLRILGGQPDLVVLIVLAWSMLDREQEGMVWAFAGGICLDLLSGTPLGISSLAMIPIAYLVGLTELTVYRNNYILPLALAGIGALGYHAAIVLALGVLFNLVLPWPFFFFYITLPSIFFDMFLIIPMLWLLQRLYFWLHPYQLKFKT